jgi:hypothetical protein
MEPFEERAKQLCREGRFEDAAWESTLGLSAHRQAFLAAYPAPTPLLQRFFKRMKRR